MLIIPATLPSARLFFLAPFLIIMYYQKPLLTCLWASLLCGLMIDLLSSYERLGICAANYTLTTFILYRFREHFFSDSLSTLPLMTVFFALISTFVQLNFIFVFDQPVAITYVWFWHDLVLMPLADAFYAFAVFILPFLLFSKPRRKGKDYFMT